jgi:hypothetical protein
VRRFVLLGLGPALALGAFMAVAVTAGDLPDPLATHWGVDGAPDGSTSAMAFLLGVTALWALGWVALAAQLVRRGGERLSVAPFAWALMWFASAIGIVVVLANADAPDWRAAGEVSFGLALLPAAAGMAGAAAAAALERGRAWAAVAVPAERPTVGLRAGERAVWSAHLRSPVNVVGALLAGVALGGAAVVAGGPAAWVLGAAALAAVALIASLSELEAIVDERGLTVALGPLGVPRAHVPLADIAWVEPIDVDPWRWGGWGWRWLPHRRATAIVMRAGEGVRVARRDGRQLVVTVPDARTAAGLLADLADRRQRLAPS